MAIANVFISLVAIKNIVNLIIFSLLNQAARPADKQSREQRLNDEPGCLDWYAVFAEGRNVLTLGDNLSMKIAVISDIHGNLPALQAVLADIDRAGIDQIINLGDTLGGPLESALTANLLMQRQIPMIAGNHERQLLTLPTERLNRSDTCTASEITPRHRAWLASAPEAMWLSDDLFASHGTPSSDLEYWLETITDDFGLNSSPGMRAASVAEITLRLGHGEHTDKASLILCGHTHIPRVVTVLATDANLKQRCITIVNPGSVGLPAYDDIHPYKHYSETGSPHARYAVVQKTTQGWKTDLHSVAYDFEPMALLAERRNRPDWAIALRTGRMA